VNYGGHTTPRLDSHGRMILLHQDPIRGYWTVTVDGVLVACGTSDDGPTPAGHAALRLLDGKYSTFTGQEIT
jgi:hypothetical protein